MTLQNRLEQKINFINDATTKTLRGDTVTLGALDKDVETLCKEVTTLPREEALSYETSLAKLVEALDHLTTAIKTRNNP